MSFTDSGIIYYLSKYSECFGEHDRIRYADSEYLRAAGLFAGVRRMRTRQKRGTIRGGALPLLLWFLSFEISPPYLHPAPPPLRCPPPAVGVLAYCTHFPTLRCLRRARLLLWRQQLLCERERLCYAESDYYVPLSTFG